MARKIEIILVDDMDGSVAAETVRFGIDGSEYEIDLSTENATELREALARYTAVARRRVVGSGGSAVRSRTPRLQGARVGAIRRWAVDNGYKVSSRGRVPVALVQAYEKAVA